jgi:alkaline phosphatase D
VVSLGPMKPTRRSVLFSLSALPLVPACQPDAGTPSDEPPAIGPPDGDTTGGPEPSPWAGPGTLDEAAFPWAVQSADATADSVLLGLQCDLPVLGVRVVEGTESGWVDVLTSDDLPVADGHLHVEVTDLKADTTYSFAFVTDDGRRSLVGRFRTALGPDDYRRLIFGASSCLGSTGRPYPSLSRASEETLDFFCLLGDTVYADGSNVADDYRAHYRNTFAQSGFKDLAASTSIVATWDDHEVDNNYELSQPGTEERFVHALQVFGEAMPHRAGPGGTGIWRSLKWGDVLELFVLDCRGERRGGNYLSPEQMAWFKEGLKGSSARFKIVLNSVAIQDYTAHFGNIFIEDRWDGYEQRAEIIDWIVGEDIGGIFWIAGDFHFGSMGLVDPPGYRGDFMWEALAGPAGSNPLALSELFVPDEQVPFFIPDYSWLRIEADPRSGVLLVQFIGNDGDVIQEREVQA